MRLVGEGAILCNVLHVPTKPSSTADCLVSFLRQLSRTGDYTSNPPVRARPRARAPRWFFHSCGGSHLRPQYMGRRAVSERSVSYPAASL